MKQEKLCESENMQIDKDYSRWYGDPVEQQRFTEELGAANSLYIDPKALEKFKQQMDPTQQMTAGKAQNRQIGGDHYKKMDVQPWDVIDYGPKQQAIGFYRYNALKYVMRAGEKGEFKEDIAKAHHYLQKLLEILE